MSDVLGDAVARLRAVGIESPRAEARILWKHAEGLSGPFEQLLQRRLGQEPMAYIIGHKEFWSLKFDVGPGVLIPRPETETLVEEALRELPDRDAEYRVLDLGTGTGCLLVALLKEFHNATAVGVDVSDIALRWARQNVARHGLENRAELIRGDWCAAKGHFDMIVSNPPYVVASDLRSLPPDVRDFEPASALNGGADGLDAYRALAPVLAMNLRLSDFALLEIGASQHHLVSEIIEKHGLCATRSAPDLAGLVRCLLVRPTAS